MPSQRLQRAARWLAVIATVGMFVVLFMGATVTNTGSGEGCGKSWPLCHGEFIPEYTVATAIEYSHRLVTSIEGLFIAALAVTSWIGWRRRPEIRVLVPLMIFLLLLQSGLGAWAVVAPQSDAVMALHFGISLTAFASVLLTAVFFFEQHRLDRIRYRPVSAGFRVFVFGVIGYIYLLVYLGAYVRHSNASMACIDWPLCNGEVLPGFSGPVGVAFAHRLAALIGTLLIAGLLVWSWRCRTSRPDLFWGSVISFGLIIAQSLSGAFIVWTRVDLFPSMSHGVLVTLLFGSLSFLCYRLLTVPANAEAAESPSRANAAPQLSVGSPADRSHRPGSAPQQAPSAADQ